MVVMLNKAPLDPSECEDPPDPQVLHHQLVHKELPDLLELSDPLEDLVLMVWPDLLELLDLQDLKDYRDQSDLPE
jgi:hypothetical protein